MIVVTRPASHQLSCVIVVVSLCQQELWPLACFLPSLPNAGYTAVPVPWYLSISAPGGACAHSIHPPHVDAASKCLGMSDTVRALNGTSSYCPLSCPSLKSYDPRTQRRRILAARLHAQPSSCSQRSPEVARIETHVSDNNVITRGSCAHDSHSVAPRQVHTRVVNSSYACIIVAIYCASLLSLQTYASV